MISDKGRRHRAYGLYQGDTVARDNYPDRIVIFRDTLLRDFGHDPDELRAQVTRTVRHELAHHLGADELGVRELRPVMIVMTPEAGEAEIEAVKAKLATTGVHVLVLPGELTTAIGAIGDPEGVRELGLEGMAGVDRVVPISRPYKLASSELAHHEPTVFSVDGRAVGGERDVLPDRRARARSRRASRRSRSRARWPRPAPRCCAAARSSRAPRRSPSRASASTALRDPRRGARRDRPAGRDRVPRHQHADAIAEHADVVQIGARNMQNYALLEVAGKLGKPVLLKRGLSSSLDELLMAADYVLKEGNERVMLCERGIRTFETATRFTLDLRAVPWLKLHTHLPVIVDPSHASGDRRLVEPLARAAAAVGADGIIVEVHQDPDEALCDGPQALYARDFAGVRRARRRPRGADRPPAVLSAAGEVGADQRRDGDGRADAAPCRPGGSRARSRS